MGSTILTPTHLLFLLLIALLLFGAKRLPEIGRSLGTGMREFKDSVTGNTLEGRAEAQSELPPPIASAPVVAAPVPSAQVVAAPVPTAPVAAAPVPPAAPVAPAPVAPAAPVAAVDPEPAAPVATQPTEAVAAEAEREAEPVS